MTWPDYTVVNMKPGKLYIVIDKLHGINKKNNKGPLRCSEFLDCGDVFMYLGTETVTWTKTDPMDVPKGKLAPKLLSYSHERPLLLLVGCEDVFWLECSISALSQSWEHWFEEIKQCQ